MRITARYWHTLDVRARSMPLFPCPSSPSAAAAKLGISKREFKRLRKECAAPGGCGGSVVGALFILIGLQMSFRWIADIRSLADETPRFVLFFISSMSLLAAGALCFRLSGSSSPPHFVMAMLRRSRCPSCAYHLDLSRRDPVDRAVVCPECGGAWAPTLGSFSNSLPPAHPELNPPSRSPDTASSPHQQTGSPP